MIAAVSELDWRTRVPLLIRATLGVSTLHLRCSRDPRGERRAWARAGVWAIEHLEREPQPAWLEGLGRIRNGLELPSELASAAGALLTALASIGASARWLAALPDGPRLPSWPLSMRGGAPGAPYPFDAELAALELGLRRVVKRQSGDASDRASDAAWLRSRGAFVAELEHGVVLGAGTHGDLAAALELERALTAGDREAVRGIGALLGYPACCIEAFAALGPGDDATLLALRLGEPRLARRPPEMAFVLPPLALFSHAPCDAACEPTLALARAVLAHLDGPTPGFRAAWWEAAAALHAIDQRARVWRLDAREVDGGMRIDRALRVAPPSAGASGAAEIEAPEMRGDWLRWDGPFLVGDRFVAALISDHRA